jgi:hypothetical protein
MAWRTTDSLAIRSFLRLALEESPTNPLDDFADAALDRSRHAPRAIFTRVQERLAEAGLLKGKTVAIDATALEANAAMRSIVRHALKRANEILRKASAYFAEAELDRDSRGGADRPGHLLSSSPAAGGPQRRSARTGSG